MLIENLENANEPDFGLNIRLFDCFLSELKWNSIIQNGESFGNFTIYSFSASNAFAAKLQNAQLSE